MTSAASSKGKAPSGSLYLHAWNEAFMQGLVPALLCLAAFLLLVPVSTAAIPETSIFNIEYTHNQMKYRFYYEDLGIGMHGAAVISGMILALSLFRFMLNRRSSDAYFAIGIKRGKLLLLRFTPGLVQLLLAIGIPFLISLLLNLQALAKYGYTGAMFLGFFYTLAGYILLAVIAYTVTVLACCLAGTLAEAAAWSAIFLSAPSALLFGVNALAKALLFGNSFGLVASTGTVTINAGLVERLDRANPLLFFYEMAQEYGAQYVRVDGSQPPSPQWAMLAAWLGGAALLLGLAWWALAARRAEIAGVSGTNRGISAAVSFIGSFFGFSLLADYSTDLGTAPSIVIAGIGYLLIYAAIEFVQKRQLRHLPRQFRWLALQMGVVLGFVLVLAGGGFGYSGRIPDLSRVSSVDMSYVGSPNYLNAPIVGTSSTNNGYYLMASYNFLEEPDIAKVMELHRKIIDAGKGRLQLDKENFSRTVVPYDIVVSYNLWDGGKITRYYDRTSLSVLAGLLALDETAKVKDASQSTLNAGSGSSYWASGAYSKGKIYMAGNWLNNPVELNLKAAQRSELLGLVAKDVASQSLEDRYYPKEPPAGVLMFTQEADEDSLRFGYRMENALVYVTPSFANTIAYLRKNGLYDYLQSPAEIESITIRSYNPYVERFRSIKPRSPLFMSYISKQAQEFILIKDFGADLAVQDASQIAELAPKLQNTYFMSDGGYLVSVKLKNSNQYVYKYLPQKDAPSYVTEKVER